MAAPRGWGCLRCLTGGHASIPLVEDTTVLGRNVPGLDITATSISSTHCTITRKQIGVDKIVYIKDTSTNGTFINNERLEKNKETVIQSYDDICLLNPSEATSITYVYVDLELEEREIKQGAPFRDYEMMGFLGRGQYGVVKKVRDRAGDIWAMKIVRLSSGTTHTNYRREYDILKEVHHESIIKFRDVFETNQFAYIILEYIAGGNLLEAINKVPHHQFDEDLAKEIMRQILQALEYLHGQGIIHRDLKLENIMWTGKDALVKLTDFGLSRILDSSLTASTCCGTLHYVAPEILLGKDYVGTKVDVWSAGAVLFVMVCGAYPFEEGEKTRVNILEGRIVASGLERCGDELKDLLSHMLDIHPEKRFSATECLQHEFFGRKRETCGDGCEAKRCVS